MTREDLIPALAAKFAEMATWEITAFVVEPLDAVCIVGKDGRSLSLIGRKCDIASLNANSSEELARGFMAVCSLLLVAS